MPSLDQHIVAFLQRNAGKRFTARDLVLQILAEHPRDFEDKRRALAQSRPDVPFEQQLVAEVGSQRPTLQKRFPQLLTDESVRPKLYYWQPVSAEASDVGASPVKAQPNLTQPAEEIKASDSGEKSLYEPFRQYLFAQKNILALRIDERKSKNNRGSGANRWLHPDIAGMLPKGASWNSEILQCARGFGSEVVELWSFEIKEEISTSNLRESFFQAVSNSSWATYGYLVATGVSGGQETLGELEMLCAAHGIGYMHFNRIIPDESRIVIPARKREMIDWDTMNRISSQNADFRDYTRRVSAYLSSTFLDPKSWSL